MIVASDGCRTLTEDRDVPDGGGGGEVSGRRRRLRRKAKPEVPCCLYAPADGVMRGSRGLISGPHRKGSRGCKLGWGCHSLIIMGKQLDPGEAW